MGGVCSRCGGAPRGRVVPGLFPEWYTPGVVVTDDDKAALRDSWAAVMAGREVHRMAGVEEEAASGSGACPVMHTPGTVAKKSSGGSGSACASTPAAGSGSSALFKGKASAFYASVGGITPSGPYCVAKKTDKSSPGPPTTATAAADSSSRCPMNSSGLISPSSSSLAVTQPGGSLIIMGASGQTRATASTRCGLAGGSGSFAELDLSPCADVSFADGGSFILPAPKSSPSPSKSLSGESSPKPRSADTADVTHASPAMAMYTPTLPGSPPPVVRTSSDRALGCRFSKSGSGLPPDTPVDAGGRSVVQLTPAGSGHDATAAETLNSTQATPCARDLVTSSVPPMVLFFDTFYTFLFAIAPEVRPLFKHSMKVQGRALVSIISFMVKSLDNLDTLEPELRALGVRHRGYHVEPPHFDLVARALLYALRTCLGDELYTQRVNDAWVRVYCFMMEIMLPESCPEAYRAAVASSRSCCCR